MLPRTPDTISFERLHEDLTVFVNSLCHAWHCDSEKYILRHFCLDMRAYSVGGEDILVGQGERFVLPEGGARTGFSQDGSVLQENDAEPLH